MPTATVGASLGAIVGSSPIGSRTVGRGGGYSFGKSCAAPAAITPGMAAAAETTLLRISGESMRPSSAVNTCPFGSAGTSSTIASNERAMVTAPFKNATDKAISTTISAAPAQPKPPIAKPRPACSVVRRSWRVTRSAGHRPLTALTSSVNRTTKIIERRLGSRET